VLEGPEGHGGLAFTSFGLDQSVVPSQKRGTLGALGPRFRQVVESVGARLLRQIGVFGGPVVLPLVTGRHGSVVGEGVLVQRFRRTARTGGDPFRSRFVFGGSPKTIGCHRGPVWSCPVLRT
jgi:hypothetical protein